MIKLKVCGMRDPENIIQVAELQPDYMGFIFYSKSKRFVGDDFRISELLKKDIKKVGVFVNETTERIMEKASHHRLDYVQLHGGESIEQCDALKANKMGVIKVFSIDQHFDFAGVKPYKNAVDYFLFDTKSDSYGGSGTAFDWNLLKKYDQEVPFFLSGGLSPDNIQASKEIMNMNIHAFDVNSGVEKQPGIKEIDGVLKFKLEMEKLTH